MLSNIDSCEYLKCIFLVVIAKVEAVEIKALKEIPVSQ